MLQDLPELVLDVVCGHLSYEDVLALRCTCKGLKQFVDGKEFTKLNLFVRKYSFHHRLFYTDEPIYYSHSLHSDDLTILGSTRFREQFANVQRMIICTKRVWSELGNPDATEFDLNRLKFKLELLQGTKPFGGRRVYLYKWEADFARTTNRRIPD